MLLYKLGETNYVSLNAKVDGKTKEFVVTFDQDDLECEIECIRKRLFSKTTQQDYNILALYYHLMNIKNGNYESLKSICGVYKLIDMSEDVSNFKPVFAEDVGELFDVFDLSYAQTILFEKISTRRKDIIERIDCLKENDSVKEYLCLSKKNDELLKDERDLYKQIKNEKFSSCDHIWIDVFREYDNAEGRTHHYSGCIKCGLDESVFRLIESNKELTLDQEAMADYLKKHVNKTGIITTLYWGDFDMMKKRYLKTKNDHPDLTDEEIVKYLSEGKLDKNTHNQKELSLKPKSN